MNRLQYQSSPYLKQHENNPVDWYPWGEEALQKARNEDKVILVSIGYSSCHWCHVMAHECFENEQLATIMNEHFVNIKIDREERPDIDSIYMDALHAMGIRGGWPLNVFLMPDAKPFYGGTYFPPKNWQNILLGIQNAFKTDREKLQESADKFAQGINATVSQKTPLFDLSTKKSGGLNPEETEAIFENLYAQLDPEDGGFNRAPKFPMPSVWQFILNALKDTKDPQMQLQLEHTLNRIALGGIFDHIAGGWTRYSTDAQWKVPHFEKMLYDNGQLIELYSGMIEFLQKNGGSAENQKLYLWAVEKSIDWLQEEMKSNEGGYFAALDADSEGEEGKYYIWQSAEIDSILADKSHKFSNLYEFSFHGNWEHGNNVLHLETLPSEEEWQLLEESWQLLKPVRSQRIKPGLDNKLICSWNALLLSGLINAARVTFRTEYTQMSSELGDFIADAFIQESEEGVLCLNHLKFEGKPSEIFGFLDDYATVIKAFTELYQLTFKKKWLHRADSLADYVLHNFFDPEEGLFYYTDSQAEELIARKKEVYDNVIPASNSILANALFDLGVLLSKEDYKELADSMFAKVKKMTMAEPGFMTNWASVGLKLQKQVIEVAIAGPDYLEVKQKLAKELKKEVYFCGAKEGSSLPLLQERFKNDRKTYIYVCENQACQLPVTDVNDALEQINEL
ncbi:thioredoxin domain-containing protein [Jiulongibacter sediminis]|uniref:Thioredoxin n=1 Tax=Jiulongibacter sediminis TaxID=1605367 RepID=A0A0P7BY22_9BACT|nr:thioredoxin domain-containing protein [Jiulongibacter sediminis]KPM46989.1 thioredoxin [Jiulongibacter sediminis]TBX22332.1 thioredoxin [Jiulongibacter sediminis]